MYIPLIVIGGGMASFFRTTSLKRAEYNISKRLRQYSFSALLHNKPISFFESCSSRSKTKDPTIISLSTIIDSDIPNVAQTITSKIAQLLRYSSSVTYSTISMLRLNPALFALSASVIPLLGVTAVTFSKFINKSRTKLLEMESEAQEFMRERMDEKSIFTIKVCNRSEHEISKFKEYQEKSVILAKKVAIAEGLMMGGMFAGTVASILSVVNAGTVAVRNGRMTTGGLMGFATYSFLLGMGTSGIMK